jgi:hypothetical protein
MEYLAAFLQALGAAENHLKGLGFDPVRLARAMFILDNLYGSLPRPPFSEADTESVASRIYDFVWQRSAAGAAFAAAV